MGITRVKCRAEVEVGGITVRTPFVQSFNVRKQRGQISTFDASLKVPAGSNLGGGRDVVIRAGEGSPSNIIFTGICRTAKVSPCFDDPQYVMVSVSGADKLSLLEGKKFTRRCRATNASWASITGIARKGLKSGKFTYSSESVFEIDEGKLEKQNAETGARLQNSVDGTSPPAPPTGTNETTVTPKVQIYNEALNEEAN